jgi:signal transduction histidine kinase
MIESNADGNLSPQLLEKLRRLEQLERDFHARLEQEKLASLAEFAAGAGHEMNNPLAVISGRAQLLLQTERDPERRRELAVMHAQAMRVHEMIADLMLFARPPQPKLAAVRTNDLLQRLRDEVQPKAAAQDTALQWQTPNDLPAVLADDVQLAVALRALCDNALQALHRGGAIVVAARRSESDPSMLSISVCDNGPGISPEVRRHLFDPFFSGRDAGRGLGNGLAKCWRIVTNHGGSIDVTSEAGGETTFTLFVPVASG